MISRRTSVDKANSSKPEFSKDLMNVKCIPLSLGIITETGAMVPPGQSVPGAPKKKPEPKPTAVTPNKPFDNPFDKADFREYFDGDPPKLDPKEALLDDLDTDYFPPGSPSPQTSESLQTSSSLEDPRQLERQVVLMPVAKYDEQNLVAFVDVSDPGQTQNSGNIASVPSDDSIGSESDKTVDAPGSETVASSPSSTPESNAATTNENPIDELDTLVKPSTIANTDSGTVAEDETLTERVAPQEDFGLASLIGSIDEDFSFPAKVRRQLVDKPYPGPEGWGGLV